MRHRRQPQIAIALSLLGVGLAMLPGCGSGPQQASAQRSSEMGPAPLAGGGGVSQADRQDNNEPPPDIEAILAANAEALADLDALPIDRRRTKSQDAQPDAAKAGDEPAALDRTAAAITETPKQTDPAVEQAPAKPQLTRAQRIELATDELAALLRAEAENADSPVSSMAALSALELIERGVAPDPDSMPWLTERERELLAAFRDLFSEAGERLASDPNDLLSVHDVIESLPGRLRSWKRLSIPVAALCVRVDGFGQYEELGSTTLLAGRTHRMIVYTELADFGSEPSTDSSGRKGRRVRLTQDLSLYHDADGLLAWREANQKIDEFSRNERRDFFLVHLIELPRTLTVGSYRLKVTVVDETAGATAEAVIPIHIVADASLTGRSPGR